MTPAETLHTVRDAARWVEPGRDGVSPIVDATGDARLVLIGAERAGFYALDLYSLHASIDVQHDTQAYGYAATVGLSPSCEDDVVRQLIDLRMRAAEYHPRGYVARAAPARALVAGRARRSRNVSHRYLT